MTVFFFNHFTGSPESIITSSLLCLIVMWKGQVKLINFK